MGLKFDQTKAPFVDVYCGNVLFGRYFRIGKEQKYRWDIYFKSEQQDRTGVAEGEMDVEMLFELRYRRWLADAGLIENVSVDPGQRAVAAPSRG